MGSAPSTSGGPDRLAYCGAAGVVPAGAGAGASVPWRRVLRRVWRPVRLVWRRFIPWVPPVEASEGIPDQWRRFGPHIGHVPGQLTPQTYGVAFNFDDAGTFTYVAGVRVRDFSEIPGEFATVVIEPRRYAVFKHSGHVIGLHRSHYTIMNDWAPKNELAIASAPNFELYHQDFDPVTGLGTIEIWMPLDG
jgi:predicted transcriptional regulator YdeE